MINRLFHSVALHSPAPGEERRVGWLELFYDLIYVAAIIQLGNALSEHPTLTGLVEFFALFLPIWFTWTGFTFFSNRFLVDDLPHRLLVFVQMFLIGGVAVTLPAVFDGYTARFAIFYGLARLTLAGWYARAWLQEPLSRDFSAHYALRFTLGAVMWLATTWLPTPWVYLGWAIAMVSDLATSMSRQSRELTSRYPPDVLHFTERYGLLTLIVLGESFVKVLSKLSKEGAAGLLGMGALALAITCSGWWIYFDDVAGSRIRRGRLTAYIWIYTHLPLTAAITAQGVAIQKVMFLDPGTPAPDKYRWLLCAAVGTVFFCVGVIDKVTERRHAELSDATRVKMRFASALLVLLLAPIGGTMPAWAFLSLVAGAAVLQVAWDLTMAPETAPSAHHETAQPFSSGNDRRLPPEPKRRGNQMFEGAVALGVPNEFRRDLYFHFMEGSWSRMFGWSAALFVLGNVAFAGLYLLDPEGVFGLQGSFLEAFSFSVQTVSTIGYGHLYPTSVWAQLLVAVEAFIGIILVALVTGLVFAKASRPQASVLFSRPMCVTTRHGVPTLCFRCGNARGNELVEAVIRVTLLKDVVSPEGHTQRKLFDLDLERHITPLFRMSWTVFHPIDEHSPLYGMTETTCDASLVAIIVTLTGHDSTYGQTNYARYLYFPEDMRWHQRFVDVLGSMPDGRLSIDYNRFHDTIADADAIAAHAPAPSGPDLPPA